MADIVLATILLIGGTIWSLACLLAYAMHPTPGQANFGPVVYVGMVAAFLGWAWWVWIIFGWLL